MSLSLEMQYKCVFIIITQRYSVALGIERQPMSRSYAEAGGGGSSHLDSESSFRSSCVPWFSRGLVLLAPRRKTRSGPPGCAWRSDTLDAPLAYRHQAQDPLGVERDVWSACAMDSSSWSRPLASLPAFAIAAGSSRRSIFSSWSNINSSPSFFQRTCCAAPPEHTPRHRVPFRLRGD